MSEPNASTTSGATLELSRFAATARLDDLPDAVRHEGVRAIVNWVGCVLGGSAHEAVGKAQDILGPYAAPEEATVLGSGRRVNMMYAALFNSMSASACVFDDTHLGTVLHPTSPVGAAALAVAEHRRSRGADFLLAVILGDEIACRVANMVAAPPAKSHLGLFMTGIAGGVGAAVAAGRLMALNEQQMAWAIGIAASQASGLRVMHGTHTTPLMPGHAAQTGVMAAILAAGNFTSAERSLEAPRGLADVFAAPANIDIATDRLGRHFELLSLTYKPYPCGIVAHPLIDACLAMACEHDIAPDAIDRLEATVNPVAIELTGIRHPRDYMQSHNSLYHWAAAALVHRAAGLREEADACVHDPRMRAFREKITATADAKMAPDACRARLLLRDGRVFETAIAHCSGSRDRPMTDAELDIKFRGQAGTVLSERDADELLALCRGLSRLDSMTTFMDAAVQSSGRNPYTSHRAASAT